MIRNIRLFLAVLLLLGLASAAIAQFEDDKPSKIGIGLVNFMPLDSDLKDLRSMWLGPVIDWHMSFDEEGRPDRLVSLGFIDSGDKSVKASEEFVTYTKINRTPISETRTRYIGYGGGFHRLKLRSYSYDDETFKPSVHALYGQEFNNTYFAEIRVDMLPKWKDADWGGISLNIGTRVSL